MTWRLTRPFLLVLALILFAGLWRTPDVGGQERHVVLVSIDGLSATYLDDPKARLPTLRHLAREGAHAEGMLTSFPSVTWPSHVSLITGVSPARHGVIGNSVLERESLEQITYIGDPVFTKEEAVKAPTLYDAVHQAGLKTAAIIWPATNGAKTLDWMIPDSNQQRIHDRYTTPGLAAELAAAHISIARLGAWGWSHQYSAMRDATYTQVGIHLLQKHRPHLLLMHLITPDGFEHDYGPNVEEAYWACSNADDRIREIWEALQQPPLAGKSTLVVVSDHGFAEYTRLVQPNVLFRQLGLVNIDEQGSAVDQRAWSHSSGGSAAIYLRGDETAKAELKKKITPLLADLPGVDAVLDVKDFMKLGLPDPRENPQQGDLMMSAKPGFAFSNDYKSDDVTAIVDRRRGAHGHLPGPRYMHATFIAAGAGIKPGARTGVISNLDVAPTIARLLGVELPSAEGRVLSEVLEESPP